MDPCLLTYSRIRPELINGKLSCYDLAQAFLERISSYSNLNCFLEVYDDEVLERAKAIDRKIRKGKAGKLAGMFVGLKDTIAYKGHIHGASSRMLESYYSPYNAFVVERLLAADAIIPGRLNCDEFAMGSSNERTSYGSVLNPVDHSRVPGGSSGGSAAAVRAKLCHTSLGSDTGGSVRQPASFCGVWGLKPTYGRISRQGLIAYASSLDQIGPLSRNIYDLGSLMQVVSGKDFGDTTSSDRPFNNGKIKKTDKKNVAIIKEFLDYPLLDREIHSFVISIAEKLAEEGHVLRYVSFPYLKEMIGVYHCIADSEASSNMARFDGLRYGRQADGKSVEEIRVNSRNEGLGEEVKRKIMLGTYMLSAYGGNEYYEKACKIRRKLLEEVNSLFGTYDLILAPTTPNAAFKHGEIKGLIEMYMQDVFLLLANLTGIPSLSIPLGTVSKHLPFGIQLMAKHFDEKLLFDFSINLLKLNTKTQEDGNS